MVHGIDRILEIKMQYSMYRINLRENETVCQRGTKNENER